MAFVPFTKAPAKGKGKPGEKPAKGKKPFQFPPKKKKC